MSQETCQNDQISLWRKITKIGLKKEKRKIIALTLRIQSKKCVVAIYTMSRQNLFSFMDLYEILCENLALESFEP